jgi:hypothetical protein
MIMDESIVTIGISGINGINGKMESGRQTTKHTAEAISLEESMIIDVNLTSHEYLKLSNFECFLYVIKLKEEAPMDTEH